MDFPFCLASGADAPAAVTYPVSLENFPNPVLEKTTITFSIPMRTYTTVRIYDALGRLVRSCWQTMTSEGSHSCEVSGLIPGSYRIELSAPEIGVTEYRNMIVM